MPKVLIKETTHREFRTMVAHYENEMGIVEPKKKKSDGKPMFEPLPPEKMMKQIWAARLGIKDKIE